jgi:hypothetical protein
MNTIKITKALPNVRTKVIIVDFVFISVKLDLSTLITKDIRSSIIYLDKMLLDSYLSKEVNAWLFGLPTMDIIAVINVTLKNNFIRFSNI